jgi:hypothetical protein
MAEEQKIVPSWILIVTGIFAFMELMVSIFMFISPATVGDNVDLTAKGVGFLISMWASRQFALGFIFAFATLKRSIPMLTLAYIFFLVMFVGDLLIGVSQQESPLIVSSLVMCAIASAMLYVLHKRK